MKVPQKNAYIICRKSYRSSKMIALDELAYQQMKENLDKNIQEYVYEKRQQLKDMQVNKARKIVSDLERNINKYLSHSKCNIQLASKKPQRTQSTINKKSYEKIKIFNQKLMNVAIAQQQNYRQFRLESKKNQKPGILVKKLIKNKKVLTEPSQNQRNRQSEFLVTNNHHYKSKHSKIINSKRSCWQL